MNETSHPDSASAVPWPTGDHRLQVPDTAIWSESEKAPPAAVGPRKNAVQRAHDTPLASVAAAFALGGLIARISR